MMGPVTSDPTGHLPVNAGFAERLLEVIDSGAPHRDVQARRPPGPAGLVRSGAEAAAGSGAGRGRGDVAGARVGVHDLGGDGVRVT